jgi:hypothetical protein
MGGISKSAFSARSSGSRQCRIHRAIARAFMVHGDELTTAQALDWALPRVRRDGWRQRHRWSVVRVLRQVADPIHRVPPHGAWLWKLRTDDD